MAIRRNSNPNSGIPEPQITAIPSSQSKVEPREQTSDNEQIQAQYKDDAQSNSGNVINTGAMMPKDMTVRLVRAEVSNLETLLQILYSITSALFFLFLGASINSTQTAPMSELERLSTFSFGAITAILLISLVVLRLKQTSNAIHVPHDVFKRADGNKVNQEPH